MKNISNKLTSETIVIEKFFTKLGLKNVRIISRNHNLNTNATSAADDGREWRSNGYRRLRENCYEVYDLNVGTKYNIKMSIANGTKHFTIRSKAFMYKAEKSRVSIKSFCKNKLHNLDIVCAYIAEQILYNRCNVIITAGLLDERSNYSRRKSRNHCAKESYQRRKG